MFANIVLGCRRLSLRRNVVEVQPRLRRVSQNEKVETEPAVKIPPRIERGPLDILQALSETIGFEPQAALFNSQMYTFKESQSMYGKKELELSYDSGKKAAKWIFNTHPELFTHEHAEPSIEAFVPDKMYVDAEPSEQNLLKAIEVVRVKSAIEIYQKLIESGIEISASTKQKLLELVCFYNAEDKDDNTSLLKLYDYEEGNVMRTWKSGEFAEELFSSMEPNAESYCALICGMFKYNDLKNATTKYKEAVDKGFKLPVEARNYFLRHVKYVTGTYDLRSSLILQELRTMREDGVRPNVGTMNAVLFSIGQMRNWIHSRGVALKTYGEFVEMGIKPCLATYYHLLVIMFNDLKNRSSALEDILSEVEGKQWEIVDPEDFSFFVKAMTIAELNFQSPSLAQRIDKFLHTGTNHRFLALNIDICFYYRSYFNCLCASQDLSLILEKYQELTPRPYIPEIKVISRIFTTILEYGAFAEIPKIWKSVVDYGLSGGAKMLEVVVSTLVKVPPNKEFVGPIAREIYAIIQDKRQKEKMRWNRELVSDLLLIFLRLKSAEEVKAIFEVLKKNHMLLVPKDEVFEAFIPFCASANLKSLALEFLLYAKFVMYGNEDKLKALIRESNFELTEDEKKLLSDDGSAKIKEAKEGKQEKNTGEDV